MHVEILTRQRFGKEVPAYVRVTSERDIWVRYAKDLQFLAPGQIAQFDYVEGACPEECEPPQPIPTRRRLTNEQLSDLIEYALFGDSGGGNESSFTPPPPQDRPVPEERPQREPEPPPNPPAPQIVEVDRIIPDPADKAEIEALRARAEAAERALAEVQPPPLPGGEERGEAELPNGDEKLIPPQIASLMEEGETLTDAVNRMTPDLDSLVNLAGSLDDDAVKAAIGAMSGAKRIQWVEQLNDEKGRLRRARGTDNEDLAREARIDRLTNLFARVGEKQ